MDLGDGNIIIVFDGYCVLCDNFVKWIVKKDINHSIHFTTFQSDYMRRNYSRIKLENSVIVIDSKKKKFDKSEAVVICLKTINYNKVLISILEKVPKSILDFVYNLVAISRYKIYGKKKTCSLPINISTDRILS